MSSYRDSDIGRAAAVCAFTVLTLRLLAAASGGLIAYLPESMQGAALLAIPLLSIGGANLLFGYLTAAEPYGEEGTDTEKSVPASALILLFCGAACGGMLAAGFLSRMLMLGSDTVLPVGTALIFYTAANVVLAPCLEEMLFRRSMLNYLRKYGGGFAVFASAFLFAMSHTNAVLWPPAFLCGAVLAVCAAETKSIVLSSALHVLYNFSQLLMLYFEIKPNVPTLAAMLIIGIAMMRRTGIMRAYVQKSAMLKPFFCNFKMLVFMLYAFLAAFL